MAVATTACAGAPGDYPADPTSPGTGVSTSPGGGTTSASAALVGRWSRIVYFDDASASRSSQTTWSFDGAGSFTRVVVATNYTDGIADAVTSAGSYTATGATITVRYLTPQPGTATFAYRVQTATATAPATLYLDQTAYTLLDRGALSDRSRAR